MSCERYAIIAKDYVDCAHYVAYSKRGPRNWELSDDTNKKKSNAIDQNTKVICELIIQYNE